MTSAGPGRRRWWLAGGAVAVVAVTATVIGVAVLPGRNTPSGQGSCDAAGAKRTGVTSPVAPPPENHGLRVVEKGFTQLAAPAESVSLGTVLANDSTIVAYRTRIRFSVFDRQHHSATLAEGQVLYLEIPVILPGQRTGVGTAAFLREDGAGRPVTVAGFDVEISATQWWPRHNDVLDFRPISTHHMSTKRRSDQPPSGILKFSVDSSLCHASVIRGVSTLFRDHHGALVGGGFVIDGGGHLCQPGKGAGGAGYFDSIPPGIDDSRTQTFIYCDPRPAQQGHAVPGRTVQPAPLVAAVRRDLLAHRPRPAGRA